MDANDLTPENRDTLARALRNPVTREALDWLESKGRINKRLRLAIVDPV